jgi:predicted nucleic acid-binding protein
MLVIADASPLILLDRLGHLSLLPDLYGQVVVPQAVLEEIAAGAEKAGLAEIESAEWIEVAELPEDRTLLAALLDDRSGSHGDRA